MIGTIIGCALFQLLGIYGVNKLTILKEQKMEWSGKRFLKNKRKEYNENQKKDTLFMEYSYSSQYLIFCAILLLFLSADYLLGGEAKENVLSKIDGGLLIFLFVIYLYIVYGKRETSFLKNIHSSVLQESIHQSGETVENLSKERIIRQILGYILLILIISIGNYMLFGSVSKIGVQIGISQYCTGLTLMTWCIHLSGILLIWIYGKKKNRIEDSGIQIQSGDSNNEIVNHRDSMEEMSEDIIFSITILLGSMVLIKPIMIHMYIIYDLILLGIVSVLLQFVQKIDNRLAGSGMATVYIGFIVYAIIR